MTRPAQPITHNAAKRSAMLLLLLRLLLLTAAAGGDGSVDACAILVDGSGLCTPMAEDGRLLQFVRTARLRAVRSQIEATFDGTRSR